MSADEQRRISAHAAHLYEELGLCIVPVHHPQQPIPPWMAERWDENNRGKVAMVKWQEFQGRHPKPWEVDRWFHQGELHNLALPTGAVNGFNVVDLDSAAAIEWAVDNLPVTPCVCLTSADGDVRKQHWYYRADPGQPLGNKVKIRIGDGRMDLDVRGTGGYVLAPGSLHRSGTIYEWQDRWTVEMLADLPLLDPSILAQPSPAAGPTYRVDFAGGEDRLYARARAWMRKRAPAVSGSGGDSWTFTTAAALLNDFGLSPEAAWSLLSEWNASCRPPWTEKDLRVKLANAGKYAKSAAGVKRDDARFSAPAPAYQAPPPGRGGGPPQGSGRALALVQQPKVAEHPRGVAGYVNMAQVERRRVGNLLTPYIPMGEITLLSGPGGRGKSLVTAALMAAVSAGLDVGRSTATQGGVLLYSAEDELDAVLQPRLLYSGADLAHVNSLPMTERAFILNADGFREIEAAIDAFQPLLVVLDPFVDFTDGEMDMNAQNQVAAVIRPLRRLLAGYRQGRPQAPPAAGLLIVHHNKSDDILGSVQFWNGSRSVLSIYEDPADERRRYVAHRKRNHGPKGPSLHFEIQQADPQDEQSAVVKWLGVSDHWDGDRLKAAQLTDSDRGMVREAEDFLRAELAAGKRKAVDVGAAARKLNISGPILTRARIRLSVRTYKLGHGDEAEFYFELPNRPAVSTGGEEWFR